MIAGGVTFVTEYIIFVLLFSVISINVLIANTAAFVCGILISFMLNRGWSFKKSAFKHSKATQSILYIALAVTNLGLTSIALTTFNFLGVREEVTKILMMCAIALWNFIIFSRVIFRQRPAVEPKN